MVSSPPTKVATVPFLVSRSPPETEVSIMEESLAVEHVGAPNSAKTTPVVPLHRHFPASHSFFLICLTILFNQIECGIHLL